MRMGPQVGWKGGVGQTGPRRGCMLAWQGGRGARFVVRWVIDGRRSKEVLLLEGQGGGEEGRRCSYYVYN